MTDKFLSTPSARRATRSPGLFCFKGVFLSTPSARRATCGISWLYPYYTISIHALREEGDLGRRERKEQPHISIHALREEGDVEMRKACPEIVKFLSTPSARRATRRRQGDDHG